MNAIREGAALERAAARLARVAGIDWACFAGEATELVIFGSRAAGVNTKDSDLDVLWVGDQRRRSSGYLDLVRKSRAEIEAPTWLGSELASHVAAYGVWLVGDGGWRGEVRLSPEAAHGKERRIGRLADRMAFYWDRLHPEFQVSCLTTVRRETQRLELLRAGTPIPPTPVLDEAWVSNQRARGSLASAARTVAGCSPRAREMLARVFETADWPKGPNLQRLA